MMRPVKKKRLVERNFETALERTLEAMDRARDEQNRRETKRQACIVRALLTASEPERKRVWS